MNSKRQRIFQIHPSQHCNYTCLHCYSSSSPMHKESLDTEKILNAVREVADLGFERLSISGGEPLLYSGLKELLTEAKKVGMNTSLVTNGSFPKKKYEELVGLIDTIGVSLDGKEALHNEVRQNTSAFEKVDRFLDYSRDLFPSVGVVLALSDQSWEDLPDMLEFGKQKNVNFFQFHPLESVGRASATKALSMTSTNLKRAYLLTKTLGCQYSFPIQFDVLTAERALKTIIPNLKGNMAVECIDIIVMNEHGKIQPYTYGIDSRWQIADLNKESVASGWNNFKLNQLSDFYHWCEERINLRDELLFAPSSVYT